MPPIGPQPTTAVVRGHDQHAERREGVSVDRVGSALELVHRWPRSVMDTHACGRIGTEAGGYTRKLSAHIAGKSPTVLGWLIRLLTAARTMRVEWDGGDYVIEPRQSVP
jgi:hypothetical protein